MEHFVFRASEGDKRELVPELLVPLFIFLALLKCHQFVALPQNLMYPAFFFHLTLQSLNGEIILPKSLPFQFCTDLLLGTLLECQDRQVTTSSTASLSLSAWRDVSLRLCRSKKGRPVLHIMLLVQNDPGGPWRY